MSTQQRILLAVLLAFIFFTVYDYFYIGPKRQLQNANNTTISYQTSDLQQEAPSQAFDNDIKSQNAPNANNQIATSDVIAKLYSDEYEVHIDKLGRVSKFFLNGDNFKDSSGNRIQLIDSSLSLLPLEIRFSSSIINNEAFITPYKANVNEVRLSKNETGSIVLTQELSDVTITKAIVFTQDKGYKIKISLSKPYDYFISPGFRPNVVADGYTFHGVIIQNPDGSIEKIEDGDIKENRDFSNATFVAASDRYYTTLLSNFEKGLNVVISSVNKDPNAFIRSNGDLNLVGYIGPKTRVNIRAVDERLDSVIEYGFFTVISKPLFSLLNYLHSLIGNWGWSIVAITILIRLVLYPITYRGMVSMNKLKDLAPRVKELQAQYKDDKQKLNVKMMELYKKHGANPMGGCLPILIQIPIFFALYRVLLNAIELKNAPWIFWIEDLAAKDPFFVLPILMGATMFLQQKLMPMNFADPMQEKIMRLLPIIFTFFFLMFPAGLTLYWFVNNLFAIAQQMYVNRVFSKQKEKHELSKKEKHDKS